MGSKLRGVVALATLAALLAPGLALAQDVHTFTGFITGPTGKPGAGFKVVLVDMQSGKEFLSPPTDANGLYSLAVPAGTRYTLVGVLAPDGTEMTVQEMPPSDALTPGVTTLSVRFRNPQAAPVAAPPPAATAAGAQAATTPWWKNPWIWVGIGGGVALAAVIASSGDDDEPQASPSAP
jgi:hypothetical protein